MNPEAMQRACDKLGWKYTVKGGEILITDLGGKEKLHGELALKVHRQQLLSEERQGTRRRAQERLLPLERGVRS